MKSCTASIWNVLHIEEQVHLVPLEPNTHAV